jgi:hypothetical protein
MMTIIYLKDEFLATHNSNPHMKDIIDYYGTKVNDPKQLYKFTIQCQKLLHEENLDSEDSFHPNKNTVL